MNKINENDAVVAHLFWDTAPHLERSISKLITNCWPNAKIYLADQVWLKQVDDIRFKENESWIKELPSGVFGGVLMGRWWRRLGKHKRVRILAINALRPQFDVSSILKIAQGSKYWVIHGGIPLFFPTMLMFKLLGKRVVVIHWGGRYSCWRHLKFLGKWAHKLVRKIFVLMEPELESFKPIVGARKLSVLPYASMLSETQIRASVVHYEGSIPRCMILGNSAWRMADYPGVLDAICPEDWDKIICMLNYGDEESSSATDAFVRRYVEKFGDKFFPWRETLPYAEYLKMMEGAPFYLCAAKDQTGMGAIHNALRQGKAVFIRGDNLKWFRSLGFTVYDLDQVGPWTYENLIRYFPTPEIIESNIDVSIRFFQKNRPENWRHQIEEALFA